MNKTSNKCEIGIHYGLMAPRLSVQIHRQGFEWKDKKKGKDLQKMVNDVLGLWWNGILTDKVKQEALGRLQKAIIKNIKKK